MPIIKPSSPVLRRGHPLARGIVGAWAFNERGGNTVVRDLSGGGHDGATVGSPSWTAGPYGGALDLNGSSQRVNVTNGPTVDSNWTIAGLVRLDAAGNYPQIVSNSGVPTYVELRFNGTTRKPELIVNYSAAGNRSIIAPTAVTLGEWNFVAGTADGSNIRLYVNGSLVAVPASSTFTPFSTMYFGARNGSSYMDGAIAGIWIWDRPLSDDEIALLYYDPFAIYRRPSSIARTFQPAAGGINGSLSKTLAANTVSAAGKLDIAGSASATLAASSVAATGKVDIAGSLSKALAANTLSAAGELPIVGSVSDTLAALSVTADGVGLVSGSGSLSATLAAVTLSAASKLDLAGSLSKTLAALSLSADGSLPVNGALGVTLAALGLTADGVGVVSGSGDLSATLAPLTVTADATISISGALSATLARATLAAEGASAGLSGSLSATLAPASLTAAAELAIAAQAAPEFAPFTLVAVGASVKPPIDGAATLTLAPLSITVAAGAHVPAPARAAQRGIARRMDIRSARRASF